jgi:calcineurin-like phosphoesterase family protein
MQIYKNKQTNLWFTADWHINHISILKYCNRPFKYIYQMNEAIRNRINKVVMSNDYLFVLGDVTLGGYDIVEQFIESLNCKNIYIQPGSHDSRWMEQFEQRAIYYETGDFCFTMLPPLVSLEIEEDGNKKEYPDVVVLSHYAMRVWDRSHYGSMQLYGHSHGKLGPIGRQMDVGVDTNKFYPYSYEDVKRITNEWANLM